MRWNSILNVPTAPPVTSLLSWHDIVHRHVCIIHKVVALRFSDRIVLHSVQSNNSARSIEEFGE